MEKPKKAIKTIRDIEKLMQMMQKNRISLVEVEGVKLAVNSFQVDVQQIQSQQENPDEYIEFYSS